MSSARKKDNEVKVSITSWLVGGRLLSATPTTRSSKPAPLKLDTIDGPVIPKSSTPVAKCEKCGKKKPQDVNAKSDYKKSDGKRDEKKDDGKSKNGWDTKGGDTWGATSGDSWGATTTTGENKNDWGSATVSGDAGKWTADQDTKIKSMKEDNKSWKDIAAEVGASKKDVQSRYKELMKSDNGEKKDGEKTGETKDADAWEPLSVSTWVDEDAADKEKDKNEFDFSNLFGDDNDDNPVVKKRGGKYWDNSPMDTSGKKDGDTNTWDTAAKNGGADSWETKKDDGASTWDTSNKNDKSSNGDGSKKQKGGNNKNKNNGKQQSSSKQQNNGNLGSGFGKNNTNQNQDSNGFSNSGSGSGGGGGNGGDNNTNARDPFADPPEEQESHTSRLQADDVWTARDCLILEYLEAQHRENKWLEMQAGFFNITKRMVHHEIIEQKFRDDGAI